MKNRKTTLLALLLAAPFAHAGDLTLEQIMADADWLGNKPQNAYWGADSRTVYFEQKRDGSKLTDLYSVDTTDGAIAQVAESSWSQTFRKSTVYSKAGDLHAWTYSGDVFMSDGDTSWQVTRTAAAESAPMFMADGRRIAFQRDGQVFVFDPATRLAEQVTNIRFEKDPAADDDFDVMQAHQERLYRKLREAREDKDEARERELSLYELDEALSAAPIYMGDKLESQGQALRWRQGR